MYVAKGAIAKRRNLKHMTHENDKHMKFPVKLVEFDLTETTAPTTSLTRTDLLTPKSATANLWGCSFYHLFHRKVLVIISQFSQLLKCLIVEI